jgi:DNA-binding response OmpR family regulator
MIRQSAAVLVVEDEIIVAMSLQTDLEVAGFHVDITASVAQALEFLVHRRPDVCLLDLNLWGQMATPVAQRLRGLNIPFVICSSYAPEVIAGIDPMFAGVIAVSKPVQPEALIRRLYDLLGRRKRQWKSQSDILTC